MSILNDKEREIIQAIYIDNKSRATIQNRYYIGYQAVKKIEWTALDKMEKYLLWRRNNVIRQKNKKRIQKIVCKRI